MKRIRYSRFALLAVVFVLAVSSAGCLSLTIGGRTIKHESNKNAAAQVAQLEERIKALEHYAGITPPSTQETNIGLVSATKEIAANPPAPQPLP